MKTISQVLVVVWIPVFAWLSHFPVHAGDNWQSDKGVCEPAEPREGPDEPPAVPRGMYVAPPPSGEVRGPSSRVRVEGPALVLPEIKLGFPSLELPSISCFRRGPQMELDKGSAPWVGLSAEELYARRTAADQMERAMKRAAKEEDAKDLECGADPKAYQKPDEDENAVLPAPLPPEISEYQRRIDLLTHRQQEMQTEMQALVRLLQAARQQESASTQPARRPEGRNDETAENQPQQNSLRAFFAPASAPPERWINGPGWPQR